MKTLIRLSLAALCAFGPASGVYGETLTLAECLHHAAAGNYSLVVSGHDRQIAAENIVQAKSGYLPRVDFTGGYTLMLKPQAFTFGGQAAETQDPDFGFFSLAVTQTLYDFGRTAARAKRAALLTDAVGDDFTAQKKDVFLQVVEAYYGILEAKKLVRAADDEVAQRTDHLRVASNLYEQGVVTRNDLLQAQVKLAESTQNRLAADNRLENRWLYLDYLIGQPLTFRAELSDTLAPLPEEASGRTAEQAFAKRPEIAALTKVVEAGRADVSEIRTGYLPEIYTAAGVDYVENSKVREQAIYSATVGLRINLFDGLATTSRLRQSVQNLSKNKDSLRMAKEQIRLELQTAINDAKVAAQRIKTVEEAIKQGEGNLRINRDRYQEQVGTATDVIDAQTLLTQIRTDYFRAVYDYQVATARVQKAMGEL